jgi:hypothetical protein
MIKTQVFCPEISLILLFQTEPIYFMREYYGFKWPHLQDHYPEIKDLNNEFQTAEDNYALLIGISLYKTLKDQQFLDLN